MQKYIEEMSNHTDLLPWYWLSYGEKCYAFAVVEAFPAKKGEHYPAPGTEIVPHIDKTGVWIGENGIEMLTGVWITEIKQQNGDTICRFIANAHWHLMKHKILSFIEGEC